MAEYHATQHKYIYSLEITCSEYSDDIDSYIVKTRILTKSQVKGDRLYVLCYMYVFVIIVC